MFSRKYGIAFVAGMIIMAALLYRCEGGGDGMTAGDNAITFETAFSPGDVVSVTAGTAAFNMVYAMNSSTSIVYPALVDDSGIAAVEKKFFIGETEVTNKLTAQVLQWAYDNGKFSNTVGDPDGLDSVFVKHGGQILLNLSNNGTKINYGSGRFTIDAGFDDYPVAAVTWYGAVVFCNWLTEMKDGNTDNVVYLMDDLSWDHDGTVEFADKTGYRLLSYDEWSYAARFIGTSAPMDGDLAAEYVSRGHNGSTSLSPGFFWTPGEYASGANADCSNQTATGKVAVYNTTTMVEVKSKGKAGANALGLYDMSGNVSEWCFPTITSNNRMHMGGNWAVDHLQVRIGYWKDGPPDAVSDCMGFRLAKTAP